MRTLFAVIAVSAALVTPPVSAGQGANDSNRSTDSLQRDFGAGGHVHMDLSAGEYHIIGTSDNRLRLEWSVRNPERLRRVRALADIRGSDAWIDVDGPDNGGLRVTIRVPRRSDLTVDMSAGEIRVEGVEGNKNIESYAGEVRIDVGRAADYRRVHASVWAGEIKASAFRISKDGLFRSFDWSGRGPYVLTASLWAGELWLYENTPVEAR